MPFSKGQSPNPDGRKVEAQVKRAARAEGENCVKVLAAVRDDQNAAPEVRADASSRILAIGVAETGCPKRACASAERRQPLKKAA